MPSQRDILLEKFYHNRILAHKMLFPHRHKDVSPAFHHEILSLFYSPERLVALEAFRGAAKSTLLEECVLLSTLFRDFVFPIIVGNSWGNACLRLAPIKQELINNDMLIDLFGDQVSSPWTEDEIGLANGAKIKALGARQSMRGVKHNDDRPDLAVVDDLEDEESVATEEARRKNKRWLNSVLRPALHPKLGKIRMVGTPLHPKALIEEKCRDPRWVSRKFPVCYFDENGVEVSTWPDRFSMETIRELREDYMSDGNVVEFEQEYMCRAEDAASKPFQTSMIKVQARPAGWMPVKIMVDPARTTGKKSARTGYAVWAWTGTRMTVLDAFGKFHKPDEILNTMFELDEKFNPVEIGVEADGLEEFIMQPLRAEQLKRGVTLPIRPMRAPRDKVSFITSLQPFYLAGDIVHADNFPDLVSELLQFPSGRVDVPNALAYALRMRAGKPVYEDFSAIHISTEIEVNRRHPRYLLLSSRPAMIAGVLVQVIDGALRIYKDWVKQGPAMDLLEPLVQEAIIAAGEMKIFAPAEQHDKYMNHGLPGAARELHLTLAKAGSAAASEGALVPWLRKQIRGVPAVLVHEDARWVLNGMADGYARRLAKDGTLENNPTDDHYKLVMETIEAFASSFALQNEKDSHSERHYATTKDGRRYLTTLPR